MHEIDFKVPLSGSTLFDMHTIAVARNLCSKFPNLTYEFTDKDIHIHGELNDYWYEKWNNAVFQIGEINI